MDSGLVMSNGERLTLSAFLSSCQSATGSKQFPDEAVRPAAGSQFVGFRGVIGTMWSVGDEDALNVATEVYKKLFKDSTAPASASAAALALHQLAVLYLHRHDVPLFDGCLLFTLVCNAALVFIIVQFPWP